MGKAIRAAAQDAVAARLMGVNINVVLALCFGLGALMAGMAGALVSMINPVQADMGMAIYRSGHHRAGAGRYRQYPGQFHRRIYPGNSRQHRHQI